MQRTVQASDTAGGWARGVGLDRRVELRREDDYRVGRVNEI